MRYLALVLYLAALAAMVATIWDTPHWWQWLVTAIVLTIGGSAAQPNHTYRNPKN